MIAADLFLSFCQCPMKASLKAAGVRGTTTQLERSQPNADKRFREEALAHWLGETKDDHRRAQPLELMRAVESGAWMITHVTLEALGVRVTCDLIEKQTGGRGDQPPRYVPVVFLHDEKIDRLHLELAALHGIVLGEVLGQPVPFVKLVRGHGLSVTRVNLQGPGGPTRVAVTARQTLDRLRAQMESLAKPELVLNAHCPACEYLDRCRSEALAKDDISLLRGLSVKEVLGLRRRGIETVAQLARSFRPKSIGLKTNRQPKRHVHALQALAIQDKKVYVVRSPEMPARAPRVYLDVEGLPDRDFYYLIGVVVERDEESTAHSFWADDQAGEEQIWREFVALLANAGDHALFHYGSYERTFLKKMLKRYPVSDARWIERSINVLAMVRTHVYFPAYSNGLKDIAAYLGATWGDGLKSGLDCAVRRRQWDDSRNERLRHEIIEYNQADCEALRRVVHFLIQIASAERPSRGDVQPVSEIAAVAPRRFGKIDFAIPEMDFINRCARFNYQREKVLIRTDSTVRASVRRKRATARPIRKANTEVVCALPTACPACGATQIRSSRTSAFAKLVYDLKFHGTGVKRWVVRFSSRRGCCGRCGKTFYGDGYPTHQQTGHALASWMVYQHVALRLSFVDVMLSLNDLFGYAMSDPTARRSQARLATTHQVTLERMLDRLRAGHLIHCDETKILVKRGTGYVWALSSGDTVVYLYSPNREGALLRETISGFGGVLVSDFYSAYDSLPCSQQKCHLHLMRDINEDLCQNPFDDELKDLARRYTVTLKSIVDTIDRFGLVAKRLKRHRRDTQAFLEWVARQNFGFETATGYKTRFAKYGDRLFTLLDHDGVPWNNNSAENAIKLVAARRKIFGTSVTETGLKDYLVVLSIYQTLRRRGLSLLRFLLSGATDIEEYSTSRGRR